ncbi:MAG: glycosyltransferase family 39 protein [Bacteroidales bacterium]|nr:glycosyltransferase family 39 protein [Bacteroidales bacterium]
MKQNWIIGFIALGNIALHLAFYNSLGFHRDELLYFSLGENPSAGYASVPPYTGILAWLMIRIAGSDLFAARLLPAIFSGILVVIVALITREMKGGRYAQVLAATGVVFAPINLRGFSLFQPVFSDIFFWTLIFWLVLRLINTRKNKYLYFIGIVAGLAFLNKYLVVLQLLILMLLFLMRREYWIFIRRSLPITLAILLLMILPNLIWQYLHHFPVITHMHALRSSQLVHVDRFTFLTDQVILTFMGSLLTIPGMVILFTRKELAPYRILGMTCWLALLSLFLLHGKSYYSAGILPFLTAAGAIAWEGWHPHILQGAPGGIFCVFQRENRV